MKFLFIDEFDAFYHFEMSRKILQMVNKFECQSFVTTHNTSLIDNEFMRPDCYFLIGNGAIKALSEATELDIRENNNLEKMYRNGAFAI